jgi:coenzyme F420-reducing hydrogenase gamma subunit
MKNFLLTLVLIVAYSSLIFAQNNATANPTAASSTTTKDTDGQAVWNAAKSVLENNPYLTEAEKKMLQKAKKTNNGSEQTAAAYLAELKMFLNQNAPPTGPTGPTGLPCTDALLACEAKCPENGSNCLSVCWTEYQDCLANLRGEAKALNISNLPTKKK